MRSHFSAALCLMAVAAVSAQVPRTERWRFLDSTTRLSDDPRRTPLPPDFPRVEGSIVLRGGRVFDGTGSPARPATIVITRNQIAAVLPPTSTDWPRDARVIDVAGKTVIPGLIDLHTHLDYTEPGIGEAEALHPAEATLRAVERMRFYIESGITAVRDVGSSGDVPFVVKRWASAGRIVGPRVFAAGSLITGLGGHGTEVSISTGLPLPATRQASGPDDWREAVREQFRKGADVIKVASHFSDAEIRAAVDEAHDLGLKVTCDCETFYIDRAVRAGVDMIEHPLPRTAETIRLMAERKVEADPTLIPYIIIFNQRGGYFGSTSRRFSFSKQANAALVRQMKDAGIKLGIGTDLVANWFRYLPWPYLEELRQFAALGYSPAQVLFIATKQNAELLDMADRLGTIERGKLADVVVVDGRPDESLDALAKVDLVIRDGRIEVAKGQVVMPRHEPLSPPL